MIPYDPSQRLVSLHIPKTGGTSFTKVLEQWFGDRIYLHYPDLPHLTRLAPNQPGLLAHGHFNIDKAMGLKDSYPDANQFMTVMRDPFERMISLWLYLNRQTRSGHTSAIDGFRSFDHWFGTLEEQAAINPGGTGFLRNFPKPVTAQNAAHVFDDQFVAVGLTHRLQETVDRFAERLGKPRLIVGQENVSTDAAQPFAHWRAAHERAFPLEHAVYGQALRLFDRQGAIAA